jgi:branched-chain amino acid transport system substrate-binding protein
MRKAWLTIPFALVVAFAAACGGLGGGGGSSKTVKIVSSLPMTGPSRTQTLTIINSIKMALDEVNNKVGSITIEYEALDDATAAKQSWDAAQEAENARKAIDDSKIVAYIGTYNSGAAKVAIPLLCKANLVMVSPANTYVGLTKSIPPISAANEPGTYYPDGCKRNYYRVIPNDKIQGDAAANWAKELGAKKIYITHDDQLYGKGLADGFRIKAKELGLQEVGYEAAPKADNYRALVNKIKDSGADLVYNGAIVDQNPAILLKNLREIDPTGKIKFMTGDGNLCAEFLKLAGSAAEGAYGTFGGTAPEAYTGAAKTWLDNYKKKFNTTEAPDVYAIYGYEAAKVVIAALQKAGDKADDRASVRDAVAGTKDFSGVLGKWSFDKDGDTSLTQISAFIAKSGKWAFEKVIGQ